MSAALALKHALRARLVAADAVTDLVPAAAIFDRHQRPTAPACVVIGEGEEHEGGDMERRRVRVAVGVQIWKREPGLDSVTAIAGAIRTALHGARLDLDPGHHCLGAYVARTRTMREPGGDFGRAIVTVEAVIEET